MKRATLFVHLDKATFLSRWEDDTADYMLKPVLVLTIEKTCLSLHDRYCLGLKTFRRGKENL